MLNNMKTTILLVFVNLCFTQIPKLILHFDINLTLIAEDPVKNHSNNDVLNILLAENYKSKWETNLTEDISYADYVRNYILPGDKSNSQLKHERYKLILNFLKYMKSINHIYYPFLKNKFNIIKNRLEESGSFVFQSFFKLLSYLKSNNIDYVILLSTFGSDHQRVLDEINNKLGQNFFSYKCKFEQNKLLAASLKSNQTFEINSIDEIYNFFVNNGNMVIQDDWKAWNNNGEISEFGKKFIIDSIDTKTLSIFFDDHAVEDYGIINAVDVNNGTKINFKSLVDSRNIFKVETIKAIEHDDYFIDLLKSI